MAKVKQWDGSGVSFNTTVSTSVGGTGDSLFSISNATPTWNNTGPLAIGEVSVSNATEQDRLGWDSLGSLTTWSVQMYVSMDGLPNVIKPFIKLSDSTSAAIAYIGWNTSGQFQHRNASNSATTTSTTPATGTLYRVQIYGSTASSTIHVRVYRDSDNSLFWTADPNTGSTASLDTVEFGRQDGTSYGAVVRMSHFSVWNTAADPGQYPYGTAITNARSWNGAGIADGTTVTSSLSGTGDGVFTTVNGSPAPIFVSANQEIRVQNTTNVQNVNWENYTWTGPWSVQFYVRWDALPNAVSHFLFAQDSSNARIFSLSTNSSGQIQLRRLDNTTVATSANPVVANTRYAVQVWGTAGSAIINVRIYPYGSTDALLSATQNITSTVAPSILKFGRQSSTLYGAQLFMSHFSTGEVAGALPRFESVSGPAVSPNTRTWVGPAADDASLSLADKGSTDTAFDVISGTAAYSVATHSITIPNIAGITNVQWTGLDWAADWSVRMILTWDGVPSASSHVLFAKDTGGSQLWTISVNSSGHYVLRNNAGTAIKTSGYTIVPGDATRLSVYGTAGNATVHVRLHDMSDNVVWTEDSSITATAAPGQFMFGRQSSTPYGAVVHLGYFATDEIAGVIPQDPSLIANPWSYITNPPTDTRIPLRLLGYKPIGTNTIIPLKSVVTTWTYTPPNPSVSAFDYPFHPTSAWKRSVGTGTTYEAANTGATATMVNHSYGKVINVTSWTYPVYKATLSDPLIEIYNVTYNTQVSPWTITSKSADPFGTFRIPWAATWVNPSNTDRPVMVVQPDGVTVVEIYKFGWYNSSNVATSNPSAANGPWVATTYPNTNDLRGHGLRYGSQASGVSQMGGMLRKHEVLGGEINHLIKGSMPAAMLKATPTSADGTVSYSGSPSRAQAVFPARLQDTQIGNNVYTGNIAMGSIFAIPQSIDIDATFPSATAHGKRLLRALQNYGWCALVQSSTVAIFAEGGSNTSIVSEMAAAWSAAQPYLRRISNNFAGTLDANRVPLDSSGLMGGGTPLVPQQPPLTEGEI